MYDEARNPENPWLTKQAVHFLSQTLRADDVGIEFGSGRSTIWFARRLRHLISVENNPLWYAKVSDLIWDIRRFFGVWFLTTRRFVRSSHQLMLSNRTV
jgi:hypothetical protein